MPRKKKSEFQEKEQGLPLLIDPLHVQQIRDALSQQAPESAIMQLPPGLMVLTEEELAEELSEDEEDRAPSWELVIEGLQALQASGMKFPIFTPGEQSSGQVVFEFLPGKGVNATVFGWLRTPRERNITLRLTDKETEEVFETWTMKAMPVAIALDELDAESKDPWCTTFQVSVRDIQIT
jgi:hypothetical protein